MFAITVRIYTLFFALLLLAWTPATAGAQSAADFFRNKTIRVLIPGSPGAGSTLHVVSFLNAFSQHTPGSPTVVPQYMPGAGGASAINYLYQVAAGDPLTLAMPLAAVVIAQVTGDSSVKYDVTKMNWIGRVNDLTRVFFVWHTVDATNLLDLRSKPLTVGSTGRSSETFINPAVMNALLGTKIKIVIGYKGANHVNLAVESRETDGASGTWENLRNNHASWLQERKVRILTQIGLVSDPTLPNIPLLRDLAKNDADRTLIEFMSSSSQMGNSLVAPPGIPAPILAALRTAFEQTMEDPNYLQLVQKRNLRISRMNGADLTKLVHKTVNAAPGVIERYKAVVGAQ